MQLIYWLVQLAGFSITSKVKLAIYGGIAAVGLAVVVGAYVKGQLDCSANVKLANAQWHIEQLKKRNELLLGQLNDANNLAAAYQEAETKNNATNTDAPVTTKCGLSANWLRGLSKLR